MASLSYRQGWSFAVLLTIFPCVFFASTKNEAPPVTFRASTSEVRVSFFATDEKNHLVENLTQKDFAVVDGDIVIRDFRSLTRSNETGLDIVVLVDSSESVAPEFRRMAQDALRLAARNRLSQNPASQNAPDDKISVITFSGLKPAVLCQDNCGTSESQLKLVSMKPAGPTPLFDTLAFTARAIVERQDPAVRPVVIVFPDGNDTISLHSAQNAVDSLVASGALVYSVDTAAANNPSNGRAVLREMADATGGRYFHVHDGAANVLQAVLDDLRTSYVVTYQLPRHAPGFHSLCILPKHNLNLRFHCRRGYFYDENHGQQIDEVRIFGWYSFSFLCQARGLEIISTAQW